MTVEIAFLTACASAVVSVLVKKLTDSTLDRIDDIVKVKVDLDRLATKACDVQSELDKLDDEDLAKFTFPLKPWVETMQELTELCYIIDDIIDDIHITTFTRLSQQHESAVTDNQVMCGSSIFSEVLGWLFVWGSQGCSTDSLRGLISQLVKPWELPKKLSQLKSQLNDIDSKVKVVVKGKSPSTNTSRSGGSKKGYLIPSGDTPLPAGRRSEMQDIINKLLKMRDGDQGICIVGMAGLGKTVLANSIVNDNTIRRLFRVIRFAWAPQNDWMSCEGIQIVTVPSVNGCISQQSVSGSRCTSLLVLDDLRIKRHQDWLNLIYRLCKGQPHLFIITSRDPKIAQITGKTLHHLQALSVEDCREMITSSVSNACSDFIVSVLKDKVNRIAQKCGGLPLVADAISRNLRIIFNTQSEDSYSRKAISRYEVEDFWANEVFLREIYPDLGFDETSLPVELRKFLAYCTLFPPEYCFDKDELSQLWSAEGFINFAQQWTLKPATDHFDSLISASMLQLVKSSPKGRVALSTYEMHNFVHRYAQIVACSTYFRLDEGTPSFENNEDVSSHIQNRGLPSFLPKHIRHFSSCCKEVNSVLLNYIQYNFKGLRTFLLLRNNGTAIEPIPQSLFKKLKYLRVLSLSKSNIKELNSNISNLKHLRYLDVSYTSITKLPDGLCKLLCLQVLKLKPCPELCKLPDDFRSLINLTHLDLDMPRLHSTPANIGTLTKLQTLPVFIVDKAIGHRVSQLSNMNSLQESMKITKLENISDKKEAKEAKLHDKKKITTLVLEWTENSNQDKRMAKEILTGLKPSDNIIKLRVSNYNGTKFPNWVNTSRNLSSIYLDNCPKLREFPSLGLLGLLKSLKIRNMCKMKVIRRNSIRENGGDYPALEILEIHNMKELVEWGSLMHGDMPRLRKLYVSECPVLVSLSMIDRLPTSTRPHIYDCPKLTL